MKEKVWLSMRLRYLSMELHKTIRMLPRMLGQAVLLMFLIGVIAFGGTKYLEREPLAVGVEVAVAVPDNSTMTQMALDFVESMESVSGFCSFRQVSGAEGMELLENGEVPVLIMLPDQLVEGIMDGTNPTVKIYFAKQAGLEAFLFKELTDVGAGLLNVAQAEIYGAADTAAAYGFSDKLSLIEAEIDSYNLAFAMDRMALYETETLSSTGQMSTLQYCVVSAFVLLLLLFGMALYPILQPEQAAFRKQLAVRGVCFSWQDFCQWLCGLLSTALFAGVILAAVRGVSAVLEQKGYEIKLWTDPTGTGGIGMGSAGAGSATGGLIALVMGLTLTVSFVYFLYSLAGNRVSAILLVFFVSILLVYCSGGIVPSVFLPETIQRIGEKLPTAYLTKAFGGILTGYQPEVMKSCVFGMSAYTIFFCLGAWCGRRINLGRI
jgi:ABC-2 type transport system permease protein